MLLLLLIDSLFVLFFFFCDSRAERMLRKEVGSESGCLDWVDCHVVGVVVAL